MNINIYIYIFNEYILPGVSKCTPEFNFEKNQPDVHARHESWPSIDHAAWSHQCSPKKLSVMICKFLLKV